MKRTQRKPGPVNGKEVERYQIARGLQVDGIVGHQTFGQLLMEIAELKAKQPEPEPHKRNWREMAIGAVLAVVVMALYQVM